MKNKFKLRKEVSLKRYPGIYKVLVWDAKQSKYIEPKPGYPGYKFRVIKSVKKIRESKTFDTVIEAINWRNGYSIKEDEKSPFLKDIWARYKEAAFQTIEKSSIETKLYRSGFIEALGDKRVNQITPIEIDTLIRTQKASAIKTPNSKRSNFDKELEELRVLFNWYRENDEYTFTSPILKRHFAMGKIKNIPERKKKMKPQEVVTFLESIKQNCDLVFYDLATVQFYTASRIQEMAGLQKSCVDFGQNQLEIKYVVVWNRHKQVDYLKERPKNGEIRYCGINDTMRESLLRQYNLSKCNYVFQKKGRPLMYREIQYNYNKALKKCGLGMYASTHIMRHSMASITRNVTGSLDATQAVTGHRDIRMVEHYAGSPDNKQKQAILDVEQYLQANVVPSNVVKFKKSEVPVPQSSANAVPKKKIKAG